VRQASRDAVSLFYGSFFDTGQFEPLIRDAKLYALNLHSNRKNQTAEASPSKRLIAILSWDHFLRQRRTTNAYGTSSRHTCDVERMWGEPERIRAAVSGPAASFQLTQVLSTRKSQSL
jgi:hypothetical protein